jgi:hypothetical protein
MLAVIRNDADNKFASGFYDTTGQQYQPANVNCCPILSQQITKNPSI